MMTYDRSLKLQDYRDLARAQAGEVDRSDTDSVERMAHLFKCGYVNIVDQRYITLTKQGLDALTAAGFDRYNQREFFDNYPRMLDDME
jgi:hypothetical protein